LLWPNELSFNYPRWSTHGGLAGFLPAGGVLLALAVTWLARARWGRGPFAALVAFLMSARAAYITGQCVVADGGWVRGTF